MRRKSLTSILVILALVTLACGPCGMVSKLTGEEGVLIPELPSELGEEQPTSPPESDGEQTTPQPESDNEQPTPPPASGEGAPEIVNLDTLDSYRLNLTMRGENKDGSTAYNMTMLEEWVKEPPAKHFVMSIAEGNEEPKPFMEMIEIDDTSWIKMGGTWIQTEAAEESAIGIGAWEGLMPEEDVENLISAGEETVNGVRCKHYTTDGETNMTIPNPEEGGTIEVSIQGEVWVANQSDLPAIAIRWRSQAKGGLFAMPIPGTDTSSQEGTMYWEYDVTDINTPITIEPPK